MNVREKLAATLNFEDCSKLGGGAVLETFYPWDLTVEKFIAEGMPVEYTAHDVINNKIADPQGLHQYFDIRLAESAAKFESYFGYDPMRRMFLQLPFHYEAQHGERPPVETFDDWNRIKAEGEATIAQFFTDENIKTVFALYSEPHKNGEFSIRFAMKGFFWFPREVMGIAEHMMALYDEPELLHDMNSWLCDYYIKWLDKIFDYIAPDVLYIMEDLSGANGPMLSPAHFDEYIGAYYKKLIPFLKSKGVGHVFVDTDGDFNALIPNFIESGIDGFLPMDVNAGMDIVKVREQFPKLKFIGAFNKLEIAQGKEAIDAEFARLMPVIRQGGYVVGADHQIAPSTSMDDYKYYISRLKEAMKEAGSAAS